MTDINSVMLIGRITRDLDDRSFGYTTGANPTARANVSIAVNRSRRNQDNTWEDEVSYFDVTIWGKTAENLKPYLSKGKQIAVEGYLKQDRWDDKATGEKRSRVVIQANTVQLLGGNQGGPANGAPQGGFGQPQAPSYSGNTFQNAAPVQNNFQNNFGGNSFSTGSDFPEDIPF